MQIKAISPGTQGSPSPQKAQLEQAARQFEAIFLRQMIGTMRQAGQGEGLFDSSASDQFRDMADARTADSMAEKGSLGIAEMLLRQFGGRSDTAAGLSATAPSAAPRDKGA